MPKRLTPEEAAKLGLKPAASVAKKAESEKIRREAAQSVAGPVPGKINPGGPDEEGPSVVESMARAAHQGASYAFGDELGGVIGAGAEALGLRDTPSSDIEAEGGGGVDVKSQMERGSLLQRILDAYNEEAGAQRLANEAAAEANPKSSLAAGLAGALAAPRLPGMSPMKGLRGVDLGMQALKTGAVGGAAYGAGESEGGPLEALGDAMTGGVKGGFTGLAMTSALSRLKPYLAKKAEVRALHAAGIQKPELRRIMNRTEGSDDMAKARELGRMILEEQDAGGKKPILGWMTSKEGLGEKLETAKDVAVEAKKSMMDVAQRAADTGPTPFGQVPGRPVYRGEQVAKLRAEAERLMMDDATHPTGKALMGIADEMEDAISRTVEAGKPVSMTIPEAEARKVALHKLWQKMYGKERGTAGEEARKIAASEARQAVEDAMEQWSSPREAQAFKNQKERIGRLLQIRKLNREGVLADTARMPFGLTEQNAAQLMADGSGSVPEKLFKAAVGALGSKAIRGRGDAFSARLFDAMSKSGGEGALKAAASLTPDEERRQALLRYLGSLTE